MVNPASSVEIPIASGELALPSIVGDQVQPQATTGTENPAVNPALPLETTLNQPSLPPLDAPLAAPVIVQPSAETVPKPTLAPVGNANEGEKKRSWLARLKAGLAKTSANLSMLFIGAKIDDDLYEN